MKKLLISLAALAACASSFATTLTTNISMDNGFYAYVSTDDSVTGTLFGSGANWTTTFVNNTTLAAGTDYFLHIWGYDQGGPQGFLGEFSLDNPDHVFSNGASILLTNTTDWMANTIGFNGVYGSVSSLGTNGVGPWGTRPGISGSAEWIWSGDADNNYFTTKITARSSRTVPDAGSTSALLGIAILGLGLASRTRRSKKLSC